MDRLAFVAANAIAAQAQIRQNITHGIANVSTTGFKQSFASVTESFRADGAGISTRINPQNIPSDLVDLSGGSAIFTGQRLDIALNGNAVMGVTALDGASAYTRRGDLRINNQGALETGTGQLVRSDNGGAITIPVGLEVSIQEDGSIFGIDRTQVGPVQSVLIGKINMRDATGVLIERRIDGLFQVKGKPGEEIPTGEVTPTLKPQTLESSNINPVEYMIRLMDYARSFEHQVNLVKSAKQNDESGTSMLKPS